MRHLFDNGGQLDTTKEGNRSISSRIETSQSKSFFAIELSFKNFNFIHEYSSCHYLPLFYDH